MENGKLKNEKSSVQRHSIGVGISLRLRASVVRDCPKWSEREVRLKIIVLQFAFFFARNMLSNRTGRTAQVQKSQPETAGNRRKFYD